MLSRVLLCLLSLLFANGLGLINKICILQNGGGGHGALGFYICKQILARHPECAITLAQDKCDVKKPPFNSYQELLDLNVHVAPLDKNLLLNHFDVVIDNWSKNPNDATFASEVARNAKQLIFISSAGMYMPSLLQPICESDPVKETNDARKVERCYMDSALSFTFIRPQYLYGEKSSKSYVDYFLARMARNLPVPIPSHGDQLVALTHQADAAEMIVSTVGKEEAINQVFNCGSNRYVTYRGLCEMLYNSLSIEKSHQRICSYDPELFPEVQFPFRKETFITSPNKAMRLLGWKPNRRIDSDIGFEVHRFLRSHDVTQHLDISIDKKVSLLHLSVLKLNFTLSLYI
jgi:nucleoside-diphosphate-sugar epimerase